MLTSTELSYTSNINTDYLNTSATIPDNEIPITDFQNMIFVSGLQPTWYGIQNNNEGGAAGDERYQDIIRKWFVRYAHAFNTDYNRPSVTYIKLPSAKYIKHCMGIKFWEMLINAGGSQYDNVEEGVAKDLSNKYNAVKKKFDRGIKNQFESELSSLKNDINIEE